MSSEQYLEIWNAYQSAWGPIGGDERRRLLQESVSDDIVYADPTSQTHGLEELILRIGKTQERLPGARFQNETFLEHHDQGLFQWTMFDGNGAVFIKGMSYARFGRDGRLIEATGFFTAPS